MHLTLAVVPLLASLSAAETVLGAYIYSRHGDRTSKSTPPTVLTSLGYSQVHSTGAYYHDRYISSSSSSRILDISSDIVKTGQIAASAPDDDVLQQSATAFFQALYPPVGDAAENKLRNGTTVKAPLGGYQLVTIEQVSTGGNSENLAWLQSATNCHNAKLSSDSYFDSDEFKELRDSTRDFYRSLSPMLDRTFEDGEMNYENAYMIFDLLNVASIHNASDAFPSSDLLTDETYDRLLELANIHQFSLAYDKSEPIRAVGGSTLAGEVLAALKETIESRGAKTKLNVQFGAYASFLSFFGLAKLPAVNGDFAGIPDYASAMAFELVTNSSSSSFPDESEISVRFLFNNGTATSDNEPEEYPLFDQESTLLPWSEFASQMEGISFSSQKEWCKACGSATPECSAEDNGSQSSNSKNGSGNGISAVVAGVIGALVTLGVVLGVQALAFVFGGFKLARKAASSSTTTVMEKGSV